MEEASKGEIQRDKVKDFDVTSPGHCTVFYLPTKRVVRDDS